MVRRQMRRVASIYTFIGTAKLTERTVPPKLVNQAAVVRIDFLVDFHRASTFLQGG